MMDLESTIQYQTVSHQELISALPVEAFDLEGGGEYDESKAIHIFDTYSAWLERNYEG